LLAAIRAVLGDRNISSLNLDQLSERFGAAGLYGKLANVVDDLSSRHLVDTSTFKRIVGGDPITADRKHRDPLTFRPFARLLFSTNDYPQSADASSRFYDGWVVIPFSAEFRGQHGEVPRHILDAHLAAPSELSGCSTARWRLCHPCVAIGCP
jgi:putative DNA primase/helicase